MRKMAALFNRTDFWNLGIDAAMNAYIANHQKEFITFAWIQGVVLCFVSFLTIFGNAFVIYASWRDPFKNLHSWPAHVLLQSSVVADLLVGLALAPMQEYWLFSQLEAQTSALSFHIILSLTSILNGVSVAHVLLLTVDRLFAIMKPFRHKCIATRQRIRLQGRSQDFSVGTHSFPSHLFTPAPPPKKIKVIFDSRVFYFKSRAQES